VSPELTQIWVKKGLKISFVLINLRYTVCGPQPWPWLPSSRSAVLNERSRAFFAATTMPTPQVTRLAAATALYDKMDRDQNGAVSLEELSSSVQV
jgi:hypothetical protein